MDAKLNDFHAEHLHTKSGEHKACQNLCASRNLHSENKINVKTQAPVTAHWNPLRKHTNLLLWFLNSDIGLHWTQPWTLVAQLGLTIA